jgi:hypothetical protein
MQNSTCLQKFHPWTSISPSKGLKLVDEIACFENFLENQMQNIFLTAIFG